MVGGMPPTDPTTNQRLVRGINSLFGCFHWVIYFFFLSLNFIVLLSGTLRLLFVFFSCGVDDIDDNGGTTTVKRA